jgi:pre-mRNA-splicing factor CDC5/CEF1
LFSVFLADDLFYWILRLKTKRKKKGIDYNADIPFEKRPAPGFYDTTEEREKAVTLKGLTNVHLSKLDGKRRVDVEQEERKKDVKRQKLRKEKEGDGDIQFVAEGTRKANVAKAAEQEQITRRKRLVLPAPQVGEEELEQVSRS